MHQLPCLHGCHLQNLADCPPHNSVTSLLGRRSLSFWYLNNVSYDVSLSLRIIISSLWKFSSSTLPTMPSRWMLTFQCNLKRRQSSNEGTNKWISQRELSSLLLLSVKANIPFLAKVIEKVVTVQIHSHLEENLLMPSMQSTYRNHHSTETALLRVMNAVLRTVDCRQDVVLPCLICQLHLTP